MAIQVLFGSQSGNAENLAHTIGEALNEAGLSADVRCLNEIDPQEISNINNLVIVTSTYGDGEPPDNAAEWLSYLKFENELKLDHLSYAVLGLGDTYYPHFCQAGKDFDYYLGLRGGRSLLRRLDCDLYYEEIYPEWLEELITSLKR